jgi:hypothetical protein
MLRELGSWKLGVGIEGERLYVEVWVVGDVSPNKFYLGDLESVFHFGRLGESTPFVYLE